MKTTFIGFSLLLLLTTLMEAQDTVHVKSGWNNIGAITNGPVGEILTSDPSGIIQTAFFGYIPGSGYQSSDTLERGTGYWIKVSADGLIIFNPPPPAGADSCTTAEVIHEGGPYPTVLVGNRCWFAKNLNVGTMIPGINDQTDNAITEKYCFDDDTANCTASGGLYQWGEAMQYATTAGSQGLCPPGWHLPTIAEYQALSVAVGGNGNALKAVGQGTGAGVGTDSSGFSLLLAGQRNLSNGFSFLGDVAYLWSSTGAGSAHAYLPIVAGSSSTVYSNEIGEHQYGISLRCIQD